MIFVSNVLDFGLYKMTTLSGHLNGALRGFFLGITMDERIGNFLPLDDAVNAKEILVRSPPLVVALIFGVPILSYVYEPEVRCY